MVRYARIPGFPKYLVTSDGRVFSQKDTGWHRLYGGLRSRGKKKPYYLYVELRDGGYRKKFFVHRLVCEAFIGPMPPGKVTRHLNGDPLNNRIENLCYGTAMENASDTVRHGHATAGFRHYRSALDEADLRKAVEMFKAGRTFSEIAKWFVVSRSTISLVLRGKSQHLSQLGLEPVGASWRTA